jgi:predicted neutral ceramidase superfamily lipid hydrolase
LRQAEAQFLFTQGVLRERAIEARSAELLAESFDARAALALAEAERKELDEIGTQRWLRRAG